ncbi:MAG TPA: hypothetical protein PLN83_11705 [Syntrophorhabdus sp.]|nr:hypothetical protein [Syntrophorhabdus sp.]
MDREVLKAQRVGVLMGGRSSERDISFKSGKAVIQGLKRRGYNVTAIDVDPDLAIKLKRKHIGAAFIALHGRWGEDGSVQGLLEIMGIPYTGSGVLGSAMAMDKVVMKMMFESMGIPSPAYTQAEDGGTVHFPLPFVVKPANEGSTIGISIVKKQKEVMAAIKKARMFDKKVMVEKYIEGDEMPWESKPLERLARDGQLMAYKHTGFWQCMDTLREKYILEDLWKSGRAPWKIWEDVGARTPAYQGVRDSKKAAMAQVIGG